MRYCRTHAAVAALVWAMMSAAAQTDKYVPPTIEELLPTMPPARFAPLTAAAVKPNTHLSDLRLAWRDEGRLIVELTYDPVKVNREFFAAYPEIPEAYNNENVAADQREWFLARIKERIGDKR